MLQRAQVEHPNYEDALVHKKAKSSITQAVQKSIGVSYVKPSESL